MAAIRESFRVEVEVWAMGHHVQTGHTWVSDLDDTHVREFDVLITESPSEVHTALSMVGGQDEMVFEVPGGVVVTLVQAMVIDPGRRRDMPVLASPLVSDEYFRSKGMMHITDVDFGVSENKDVRGERER